MELEDPKWHLVRALVAVGVARPGFMRTGIEPIRVSPWKLDIQAINSFLGSSLA